MLEPKKNNDYFYQTQNINLNRTLSSKKDGYNSNLKPKLFEKLCNN